MKNKLIIIFFCITFIISINLVLAYHTSSNNPSSGSNQRGTFQRICLERGQSIPNINNPSFVCEFASCVQCIDQNNRIVPIEMCRNIPECKALQDFRFNDIISPNIDIFFPQNKKVYNNRKIPIHIETDEFSEIEMFDNSQFRTSSRTLCKECIINIREQSFRDGFHLLTIRATDQSGNFNQKSIEFFVDTKEPRISRTYPNKNFANGNFKLEFREDNPVLIKLFYGNTLKGYNSQLLDSSSCSFSKRRHICNILIDLSNFESQALDYWFSVEDIAGQQDVSRIERLEVDSMSPIIKEIKLSQENRGVTITIDIEEKNFKLVEYLDTSLNNPRWKRLCSKLQYTSSTTGICKRTLNLRNDSQFKEIILRATDKAGNSAEESININ
jgi:hypothetical protein